MSLRLHQLIRPLRLFGVRAMSGEMGSGAGKGGGSGGSIRDAGGSFGKMEAAQEETYFRKVRAQQLQDIMNKRKGEEELFHDKEIERHQEAITRHQKRLDHIKYQEELGEASSSDSDKDK